MSKLLLCSSSFIRAAKRFVRRQPYIADELKVVLELLSKDQFHPKLKTHKLKGELQDSWACSVGYNCELFLRSLNINLKKLFF